MAHLNPERSDGRRLEVSVLNERRRRAVKLYLVGMTLDEISDVCELNRNTVIRAAKAYREGGWEAVPVQAHRGPSKGDGSLLDGAQQEAIEMLIVSHTPDELGLPFALWSRPAVTALVERETGVRLAVRTAGKYLKRWGYTPQKPLRQAHEHNPEAVKRWLEQEYPAIARRAKAEGGEILWADETGLRSDDVRGRSYAPSGKTPAVKLGQRCERVQVISAVSNKGVLRWMVLNKAVDVAQLIEFMARLTRGQVPKVFLILDNLKTHKSPQVTQWLRERRDRIEVFYVPPYSPELNPDEMLNADLKHAIGKQAPAMRKGQLLERVRCHLRRLGKLPGRIRQMFAASTVAYAA